jgi:hypothetical protein
VAKFEAILAAALQAERPDDRRGVLSLSQDGLAAVVDKGPSPASPRPDQGASPVYLDRVAAWVEAAAIAEHDGQAPRDLAERLASQWLGFTPSPGDLAALSRAL